MKIKFCGAAKIVTGSCYHITIGKDEVLVDCGMFQGRKETTRLNYEPFLFNPKKIKYVFLTHAHIDHSGLLPKLVKQGFKGTIYATTATIDLCKIMLEDSAHIQEMDNMYENRRRKEKGEPERQPLYGKKDAENVQKLFKKVKYKKIYKINENIRVRYNDAGHIIGSAIIEMHLKENTKDTKVVFSGDLGQWDAPIINNPTMIDHSDYVLCESTYGNRRHGKAPRDEELLKYATKTYKRGGKLLIPSFAIERTQELLYAFNKLIKKGLLPKEKIFLDSPLAIKATEVFKKHTEFFDKEALTKYKNPFSFEQLQYTLETKDSKALKEYKKPCIIIAGSGMATAGRIRHHIKNEIDNKKNLLLFVGYQAEGTTGRYLLEGAKKVKMMGEQIPVLAEIEKINSFSAHADIDDLIKWVQGFNNKPKIFLVHGEKKCCSEFKTKLQEKGYKIKIPNLGEEVTL